MNVCRSATLRRYVFLTRLMHRSSPLLPVEDFCRPLLSSTTAVNPPLTRDLAGELQTGARVRLGRYSTQGSGTGRGSDVSDDALSSSLAAARGGSLARFGSC